MDDIKKKLTPIQYHVTQENGTEPPFQNEYYNIFEDGIYVDLISGEVLFSSLDKFDAGCGWPSFSKSVNENIIYKEDNKFGMQRVEVRSASSHLGHVFNDGPKDRGGLRFCINSAAVKFIPKSKMDELGYGEFLNLFK